MIEVVKCDHGMGGPFDAKSEVVATYDDWRQAMSDLRDRGWYVNFDGRPVGDSSPYRGMIYHYDPRRRHTMGCITYELRGNLPVKPLHNSLP